MNKDELIRSAAAIPPATHAAAQAYAEASAQLVADVNEALRARADLEQLLGGDNLAVMEDNHDNHARFIENILRTPDPQVLVDTVLWVFRAYRARGFALSYWVAQLDAWAAALEARLSAEAYASVFPLYDWLITRQPAFAALSSPELDADPGDAPAHG